MEHSLSRSISMQAGAMPAYSPGLKQKVGCWMHERWRAECALGLSLSRLTGIDWQSLRNRDEDLECGPGGGWSCRWRDSSWLTVARVFPRVGARLLRRCLVDWPVVLGDAVARGGASPRVSVILPVGGRDRLSQLTTTLRSFMAQSFTDLEIVVAEYGDEPFLASALPSGVQHLFVPSDGKAFNKSRAMNRGTTVARGEILLLHDADVVVPGGYVEQVVESFEEGWEAVRPVRFLFHLSAEATAAFQSSLQVPGGLADVQQNNPGVSTAVLRTVYLEVGGHDERFEGWGGEDNEFLDRLRTRRLLPGAWLPAVHLWHAPAPKKASGDRNWKVMTKIMGLPAEDRIRCLLEGRRS